jgi:SSS family solute:Na+ symporter
MALPPLVFVAYFGFQWMMSANPLIFTSQRVLACRSDRDTSLALIWNTFARHILHIWPWALVALCSLLVFPNLQDNQMAYPRMVLTVLPIGLRGLMLAAILAAFMSSVDTLLNWGSSYVVNDLYRPFCVRHASERHYVWISRLSMLAMATVGVVLGLRFTSIIDSLQFVAGMLVGFVPVMLMRWFWWRINAWSELSAIATAAVVSFVLSSRVAEWSGVPYYGHRVLTNMAITTLVWLTVTFLTKPADIETLKDFYRRVRPLGWWGPVREALGEEEVRRLEWATWPELILSCVVGVVFIFGSVVAAGKLFFGQWAQGIPLAVVVIAAFGFLYWKLGQMERRIQ